MKKVSDNYLEFIIKKDGKYYLSPNDAFRMLYKKYHRLEIYEVDIKSINYIKSERKWGGTVFSDDYFQLQDDQSVFRCFKWVEIKLFFKSKSELRTNKINLLLNV